MTKWERENPVTRIQTTVVSVGPELAGNKGKRAVEQRVNGEFR